MSAMPINPLSFFNSLTSSSTNSRSSQKSGGIVNPFLDDGSTGGDAALLTPPATRSLSILSARKNAVLKNATNILDAEQYVGVALKGLSDQKTLLGQLKSFLDDATKPDLSDTQKKDLQTKINQTLNSMDQKINEATYKDLKILAGGAKSTFVLNEKTRDRVVLDKPNLLRNFLDLNRADITSPQTIEAARRATVHALDIVDRNLTGATLAAGHIKKVATRSADELQSLRKATETLNGSTAVDAAKSIDPNNLSKTLSDKKNLVNSARSFF